MTAAELREQAGDGSAPFLCAAISSPASTRGCSGGSPRLPRECLVTFLKTPTSPCLRSAESHPQSTPHSASDKPWQTSDQLIWVARVSGDRVLRLSFGRGQPTLSRLEVSCIPCDFPSPMNSSRVLNLQSCSSVSSCVGETEFC